MASKTVEWTEFPKLQKLKVEPMMREAIELVRQKKQIEEQLSDLKLKLTGKLAAAGVDTAITYEGAKLAPRNGYERKTFDSEWAKRTLVQKGVPMTEIEKHTKVTQIEPTVSISLGDEE